MLPVALLMVADIEAGECIGGGGLMMWETPWRWAGFDRTFQPKACCQ